MGQLPDGLARMRRGLVDTVRTVRGGSESIATAARQIAAGNIDLSSRTEEQAAALQEPASSMELLTGTMKQNADNARQASSPIDASVERIRAGSTLVDEAGRTMSDVIGAVQRMTDIMGEIAAASEEQSRGIDQVARAVAQMDQVTQQNVALVEEAAAASAAPAPVAAAAGADDRETF